MGKGDLMSMFIQAPWLALIPGAIFLFTQRVRPNRWTFVAGLAWIGYATYEYAISRRWLCSGECNIRVDLLLIYPALLALTIAGVAGLARGGAKGSGS